LGTTIRDIANELGVSVNTVSRALRDMPDISKETKANIKRTAEKLGYRKNFAASHLRTNKSHIIGMVVADISNPYFAGVIKGVEKVCKQAGYTIMLGNSNENKEEESAIISSMLNHGVDGILLVPSKRNSNILKQMTKANVPFVLLGRKFPDIPTNVVQSNDFNGGYLVAEHLFGLGHRKFIYLAGPMHISSSKERYDGFLSFLNEKHLPGNALQLLECDGTKMGGYQATKEILKHHTPGHNLPITAMFCFSDYVACGAYSALREADICIPKDISVVGYDNNDFSDIMFPALTTVDICKFNIGEYAAELIINLLDTSNQSNSDQLHQIIIQSYLIERKSTAAPPSHT
jgi:LacI family transcriptional regulator